MWWWGLLGCAEPAIEASGECDGDGPVRTLVVDSLRFAREVDGIRPGFDLDGVDDVCGVPDSVGPDGQGGVDNAFAGLLPALELTEARTMEDIIADSIRSGRLLMMVDLEDLDSESDDACVDFTLTRGVGEPLLGNDGELLPGQTFDRDLAIAPVGMETALRGGTLRVHPLPVSIPVQIFEYDFDFSMGAAVVELELRPDGSVRGLLGGGLPLESILAVAANPDVDPTLLPLIEDLLANAADLAPGPDGTCTQLSMAVELTAVDAFAFE